MGRLRAAGDSLYWGLLAGALLGSAVLILWLDRGTTYNVDQIRFFLSSPDFDLRGLLEPQNGNLLFTTTLAYKVLLSSFGTGFLPFRIIHVLVLTLAAALFYILMRRRIGPLAALGPTLVLLLFGSDWGHVGTALGFTVLSSIAAGLAALLLLERDDRLGDAGACAMLVIAVASFSVGLAFLAGGVVDVLLRRDRWKRAWIFLIPLALYAAWFVWARDKGVSSPSSQGQVSNFLLAPAWAFESLSAVLASLTGLNYSFGGPRPAPVSGYRSGLRVGGDCNSRFRLVPDALPRPGSETVWVAIAILLAYWTLGALTSSSLRVPEKTRYMYPGAVMVLLVASAAVGGIRFTRAGILALFAVTGMALATNLSLLRDGAAWFRTAYSAPTRALFTSFDLAKGTVAPNYLAPPGDAKVLVPAGSYFAVTERYGGTPGFSPAELARQPENVRSLADRILASALRLKLQPAMPLEGRSCRPLPRVAGTAALELHGNETVRIRSPRGGTVALGRFSETTPISLGQLKPGVPASLRLPSDASPMPWHLKVTTKGPVDACRTDPTSDARQGTGGDRAIAPVSRSAGPQRSTAGASSFPALQFS